MVVMKEIKSRDRGQKRIRHIPAQPHAEFDIARNSRLGQLGDLAQIYAIATDEEHAALTLADYFDVHLDHAPKQGATLELDSIVLVARSIGGGRVNVVGLRLPEDEEDAAPLTRLGAFRRRLSEIWSQVAGT